MRIGSRSANVSTCEGPSIQGMVREDGGVGQQARGGVARAAARCSKGVRGMCSAPAPLPFDQARNSSIHESDRKRRADQQASVHLSQLRAGMSHALPLHPSAVTAGAQRHFAVGCERRVDAQSKKIGRCTGDCVNDGDHQSHRRGWRSVDSTTNRRSVSTKVTGWLRPEAALRKLRVAQGEKLGGGRTTVSLGRWWS